MMFCLLALIHRHCFSLPSTFPPSFFVYCNVPGGFSLNVCFFCSWKTQILLGCQIKRGMNSVECVTCVASRISGLWMHEIVLIEFSLFKIRIIRLFFLKPWKVKTRPKTEKLSFLLLENNKKTSYSTEKVLLVIRTSGARFMTAKNLTGLLFPLHGLNNWLTSRKWWSLGASGLTR